MKLWHFHSMCCFIHFLKTVILLACLNPRARLDETLFTIHTLVDKTTVCPKLFGTLKMYQNWPQMSNYCAQLPPHTGLYIHGWPQIQKSPYGYTQGPKFIGFQNARIQTIFEDVKKAYFKFNQITMRPAYNGEELFFE